MKFISFGFFFLMNTLAQGAFVVPGFELVVTTPVETSLKNEDLRGPVEVWSEMIDGAKNSLDFGQMYASGKPGEPLDIILEKLEAAAARGVKIRFLLEEKMMRASVPETLERLKKIKGLELRVMEFGKLSGDGIIHAKYFVADQKVAFVGSQNFDWRALKHIHETGLKVTDPKIVGQIHAVFEQDWKAWAILQKGKKVGIINKFPVALKGELTSALVASPYAFNPKGVADAETELLKLIAGAKDEVLVQLLDYYPLHRDKSFYPAIDNAIRAAQARQVKIKLMVSHWNTSKPGIDHLKSLSLLPGVEVRIVTIPASKEGAIPYARVNHSKFMVVDKNISWVGTSNWTGGYLDKTRGLELVVKDQKLGERLVALHEQLWSSPYSAKIDVSKDYPKPNKEGQ